MSDFTENNTDFTENNFDSTDDKRIENNTLSHKYRTLTEEEKNRVESIKNSALNLLSYLITLEEVTPQGKRELAIAKTKLEECTMWAVKGVTK
jgi:hypothetical protein